MLGELIIRCKEEKIGGVCGVGGVEGIHGMGGSLKE